MENGRTQEQMAIAQLFMSLDIMNDAKDDIKKLIEKLTKYCEKSEALIQKLEELNPESIHCQFIDMDITGIKFFIEDMEKSLHKIQMWKQEAQEHCLKLEENAR